MAGKLTIVRGISGSGKSTWAADQQLRSQMSNDDASQWIEVVNQDRIRRDLGLTSWETWDFKGPLEAKVGPQKYARIEAALAAGKHVISDDTNINEVTRLKLAALADKMNAEVVTHDMRTPLAESIRRDALRGPLSVGETVIRQQAGQLAKQLDPSDQWFFSDYVANSTKQAIMVDLDGTLSLFERKGHRGPYDASKADQDEVNPAVNAVIEAMFRQGRKIIYLSGRSEEFRPQTDAFFDRNNIIRGPLHMRTKGDTRIDWLVKGELFDKYVRPFYNIDFVMDDRTQVVKFWRSIMLPTFQVAEGDF